MWFPKASNIELCGIINTTSHSFCESLCTIYRKPYAQKTFACGIATHTPTHITHKTTHMYLKL